MSLELTVTSGPKGSNPGGKCRTTFKGREREFYFKYCIGSKGLPPESTLTATHQPIYEAITAQMARSLGLTVPPCYVLLGENVHFSGNSALLKNIDSNRPFYFLSELIPAPIEENIKKAEKVITDESIYRDVLLVSDIVGKKQNYFFFEDPNGSRIAYLDLGCNFVNAVGGYILMKNKIKDCVTHKNPNTVKKELKKLEDYFLFPKPPMDTDFIPLSFFSAINPDLTIPCISSNSRKYLNIPVKKLLCSQELDEIGLILSCGLLHNLSDFKNSPFVLYDSKNHSQIDSVQSSVNHTLEAIKKQNELSIYPVPPIRYLQVHNPKPKL